MAEKAEVIRTVEGADPIELAARETVLYIAAVKEKGYAPGSGEALYHLARAEAFKEGLDEAGKKQVEERADEMFEERNAGR